MKTGQKLFLSAILTAALALGMGGCNGGGGDGDDAALDPDGPGDTAADDGVAGEDPAPDTVPDTQEEDTVVPDPVPDPDAVDLPADEGEEDAPSDVEACSEGTCDFGYQCVEGICVELQCHMGSYEDSLPDRPCPSGQVCDVLVSETATNVCVDFSRTCTYHSDCPFGFLCDTGDCVPAECTYGNELEGYGPRPCADLDEYCGCMEDGVDLGGGRGRCITSDSECP